MAIKVIANYPETEEGMQELMELQAKAIVDISKRMLTPKQFDLLIVRLEERCKGIE